MALTRDEIRSLLASSPEISRELLRASVRIGKQSLLDLSLGLEAAQSGDFQASRDTVAEASNLDVVVCVHNALDDVRRCLESIETSSAPVARIVLIDDGSQEPTGQFLREFAAKRSHVVLDRVERATGYTRAANRGLSRTEASHVLLLNSDAVLAPHALSRMLDAFGKTPGVAAAGPLSNAASWQSAPLVTTVESSAPPNQPPSAASVARIEATLARAFGSSVIDTPLLNGFALMLNAAALEEVGGFDEEAFPHGYGEEDDLCFRLRRAGYRLVIVPSAWASHAKARSYTPERRASLVAAGGRKLVRRYGRWTVRRALRELERSPSLASAREVVRRALPVDYPLGTFRRNVRITFVLPVGPHGGGSNSIVQDAAGLRDLGCEVTIAVRTRDVLRYRYGYPGLDPTVTPLSPNRLRQLAERSDMLVATSFDSIEPTLAAAANSPHLAVCYYVQDYEPLFFPEGDPRRNTARQSYERMREATLYAKSDWIREHVSQNHGIDVTKVEASLDHRIFYPGGPHLQLGHPLTVCAMIRPATPRRAPGRTIRVLARLKRELGEDVRIVLFGGTAKAVAELEPALTFDFESVGVLSSGGVAELLRQCALFVDLSDFQAFGRLALEAMACGVVPVVPENGGSKEFVQNGVNGLVVNSTDEELSHSAIRTLLHQRDRLPAMREKSIETAQRFSIEAAARSQLSLFRRVVEAKRGNEV